MKTATNKMPANTLIADIQIGTSDCESVNILFNVVFRLTDNDGIRYTPD